MLDPILVCLVNRLDAYGQDVSRVDTSLDGHVMQCVHVGHGIWHACHLVMPLVSNWSTLIIKTSLNETTLCLCCVIYVCGFVGLGDA